MYGAARTKTAAAAGSPGSVVVDLTRNCSSEDWAALPLLPRPFRRKEIVDRTLLESIFSTLVRILFASPPRTRWKKPGYALTLIAVLWQWYVVVIELYRVWSPASGPPSLKDTPFASTKSVWTIAQTFTFTFACVYLLKADNNFSRNGAHMHETAGYNPDHGFLPRILPGMSLLDHMSFDEVQVTASESGMSDAGDDLSDAVMINRTFGGQYRTTSANGELDIDSGYPTGHVNILPSYKVARANFFRKTFIGQFVAYSLVTLVLTLDAKEEYFFNDSLTRRGYSNLTRGEQVAYWIYFVGFFWGMYASVTFCCLFVFFCFHLVRSITITEQKLLSNKPAPLQFHDAVALHERLLKFHKKMVRTISHWFVVNVVMLVVVSTTILLGFAYGLEIQCNSVLLYWLSVSAMTLVSSFQLSFPLIAASVVSRRWDKMLVRLARSGTWLRRGAEYQNFMTYLSLCTPKAGFVLFSNIKISGGLFIRVSAMSAGLISLVQALSNVV